MSEKIEVGDFVEVIKWPCCGHFLKHRFVVTNIFIDPANIGVRCTVCRRLHLRSWDSYAEDHMVPEHLGLMACCPITWLRKVPPLAEPKSTDLPETLQFDKPVEIV